MIATVPVTVTHAARSFRRSGLYTCAVGLPHTARLTIGSFVVVAGGEAPTASSWSPLGEANGLVAVSEQESASKAQTMAPTILPTTSRLGATLGLLRCAITS